MPKFSGTATKFPAARGNGPVTASPVPDTVTFEGAPAHSRDLRSELFMLAVSNMVGEDTFYEAADVRDQRYRQLVAKAAVTDPVWTARMLVWLRRTANMRSASVVGAAEFVKARLSDGQALTEAGKLFGPHDQRGIDRAVIDGVLMRADEPGEALAYWMSRFGKAIPKPVKRGIGDAALRLYGEYPLLKYDTGSHAVRWADVLDLCHPGDRKGSSQSRRLRGQWQRDLFMHALARRHNRANATPETLAMIRANEQLRELAGGDPQALLDTEALKSAGMTWEDVLSLVGSKVEKGKLWEALIPVMGVFALARNVRNFDEAGVSDEAAEQVMARFSDPAQVAKSRMLPFRWLSAYRAAASLRWGYPLDKALTAALANVPAFTGRTLVLVDTSDSMIRKTISEKSKVTPLEAGAVFGVALALKGDCDLYGFADYAFEHKVPRGGSLIREADRLIKRRGEANHGTEIAGSIRQTFKGHDRVIVISDMQTRTVGTSSAVPANVPMYGFNLNGYAPAAFDAGSPNRIELGGMTDATFKLIPAIEAGKRADWDALFGDLN